MIMPVLLMLVVQPSPIVTTREPTAANPWTQTATASCGNQTLAVRAYGARLPRERKPGVLINEQPVGGDNLESLIEDLSEPRAAYRLSFLCAPDKDSISLRIVRGTADRDGNVSYLAGSATFEDGKLVGYRSEPANAETFWYR